VGYGRTWDDEGLLGDGAAVSVVVGFDLTPRVTARAVVDRLPYESDREWLRISGGATFVGGEAIFHLGGSSARPYLIGGMGMLSHSDEWWWKQDDRQYDRSGHLAATSLGAGVDIFLSSSLSVGPDLKLYAKLAGATDLDPHIIVRPGVNVVWRWE
jgi:hypothetical protein